jgi:hypothetical protein
MVFKERKRTLFIRGGPDESKTMTLYTGPLGDQNDSTSDPDMSLVMAAQPGGTIPLSIGLNKNQASGDANLYINGSYGIGGGGADYQGYLNLNVVGTSGILDTKTATLYITSDDLQTSNKDINLFVKADPALSSSGTMPLFITETQIPSSGDGQLSSLSTLYIRSNPNPSETMTLRIPTDFDVGNFTSLYISSKQNSNQIATSINGTVNASGDISLLIKSSEDSQTTLFSRGVNNT